MKAVAGSEVTLCEVMVKNKLLFAGESRCPAIIWLFFRVFA